MRCMSPLARSIRPTGACPDCYKCSVGRNSKAVPTVAFTLASDCLAAWGGSIGGTYADELIGFMPHSETCLPSIDRESEVSL